MSKLAAIRIRGEIGVRSTIDDTMRLLLLKKKNTCRILEDTPSNRGMLNKAKDFITFGEIDENTLAELINKRSLAQSAGKKFQKNGAGKQQGEGLSESLSIKKGSKSKGDIGKASIKDPKAAKRSIDANSLEAYGKDDSIFHLNNPLGGFERKGIKVGFNAGGVLGYRGKEINGLIRKML
ncbi:uL30 family ribosomal protein [Candidatus Woesearchaeota archaeon]|nr:uL30 family ribosomal protein [Candidatus Woesearchaeota archaeon]